MKTFNAKLHDDGIWSWSAFNSATRQYRVGITKTLALALQRINEIMGE